MAGRAGDAYAAACSDLADALLSRVEGSRVKNHAWAVALLREAVTSFDPQRDRKKRAAALSTLGNGLCASTAGSREINLEDAIAAYRESLAVRTPEFDADGRATTTMDLAAAYLERRLGNRRANIEMALRLVNESLRFRPRERMPEIWADAMLVRGRAYARRLRGDREANRRAARQDFVAAREVHLAGQDARRKFVSASAWADFLGNEGPSDEAELAFAEAIALGTGLVDEDFWAGRRVAASALEELRVQHAFLAMERGSLDVGFERLDAAKARMFRLAALREDLVRPEASEIRNLEKARAEEKTRGPHSMRIDDDWFVEDIHELQAALAERIRSVKASVPELGATEMLSVIPEGAMLFAPLFTPRGSYVTVVLTEDAQPDEAKRAIAQTARAAYDYLGQTSPDR